MRSNTRTLSLVLVLIAASSLVSMISLLKIDQIVHGDLYEYGLQFSYKWAMPYWTMTTIVFGMAWFNIIIAIIFQFYMLIYGRKEALKPETPEIETKPTEKVEESKEQVAEPAEKVEEKKPEETQPVVEAKPQPEQTEPIQAEEAQTETKETSTETSTTATETETKQETTEKSEETPILAGVPEEEPQTAAEETQQQVGTSPL